MIVRVAQLSGGPHDGERIELSPPADPVKRHFAITFDDGSTYVWTGPGEHEDAGETVLSLRFEPGQSVVRDEMVRHADVHSLTRARK